MSAPIFRFTCPGSIGRAKVQITCPEIIAFKNSRGRSKSGAMLNELAVDNHEVSSGSPSLFRSCVLGLNTALNDHVLRLSTTRLQDRNVLHSAEDLPLVIETATLHAVPRRSISPLSLLIPSNPLFSEEMIDFRTL
jgi:hypothetical protein